ncbi:MAG TPA: lycopene cyclase domain-containing protein [Bacteroidales bacterium]|nr:lycopene cyclase domain-containing protein [Bacteroidales bacterium]
MSLYLAVELCTLTIPLLFSFDRKVAYYRKWAFLFPAMLVTAGVFILIDIHFTSMKVWGFNPAYHSRFIIAGLPLEEILFFIIIPYCSMFIHYVFITYLPGAGLKSMHTTIIAIILIIMLLIMSSVFSRMIYTRFYSLLTAAVIIFTIVFNSHLLSRYFITFLIILVPFIIVNGILTGSLIKGTVFWYDESEISGIRLLTIPVEDFLFGFSLILSNLLLAEFIRTHIIKRNADKS